MGILDKKTRFIDLVVTQEGKRQIASGMLRAEYASLSDCAAFYDKNEKDNVSERLYFEVAERPENVIVLEKDDSGRLLEFDYSPTGSIVGNQIFENDPEETNVVSQKMVTGSQFQSLTGSILGSITKHFRNNYFLGTNNLINTDQFELSKNTKDFTITDFNPFTGGAKREVIDVDDAEPLLMDEKLTYLDAFQFLPPINVDGSSYGIYDDIRGTNKSTWDEIKSELGTQAFIKETVSEVQNNITDLTGENNGSILDDKYLSRDISNSTKQFEIIRFNKTSDENNLIIQVYENSEGSTLTKLDIVDAGTFYDGNDPNRRYEKRLFYVGKVYLDNNNNPTFINMFTVVME